MDSLTSTIPDEADHPRSRRRLPDPLRWIARIFLGLVLLLFLVWLILYITKGRFLKHPFERIASAEIQRKVTVGGEFNLFFDPIDIDFRADDISIANPRWAHDPQFFTARRLALRLSTIPLIFGRRIIKWIDLEGAHVDTEWDARHLHNTWTFGNPDKAGKPLQLPDIRRGKITGTTVTYRDPVMALLANIGIDTIHAQDTQFENDIRFQGGGNLRGHPLSFTGSILNPNQAVAGGQTKLVFHADGENTLIDVTGTLPAATQFNGSHLRFTASGQDMSDLFKFIGVSVVRTRKYHLTSNLTYTGSEWQFNDLSGIFGDSDLAGGLVIAMPGGRLKLTADLLTHALDILDAGPFIGYDPQRLNAMGTAGAIRQVDGHPRIIPDADIPVASLAAFDAHVRYRVGMIRAKDFPVSNIDVTLDLDHSRLRLDPARAKLAGGTLTGRVLVNGLAKPVLTEYDVHLSPTPMGKLLARFGVAEAGTTGTIEGRIRMRGFGDSLSKSLGSSNGRIALVIPAGTVSEGNVTLSELNLGTFAQKLFQHQLKDPVEINCGLVAFTVKDGIADADPLLIDTRKSVLTGNGDFSFRDESIDMSLRDKSKRFSLFSLQSPVGVNGYLAAPGINVLSKQLITRAGAAAAAGLVLSPFATIAAFVDLGNAKAAACGPVLAGDTAAAQRTAKGKPRQDVGKPAPDQDKVKDKPKKHKFLGIF